MFYKLNFIFRLTLFFAFWLVFGQVSTVIAQVKFIPNKGQWQQPFLYKSDLPNGNAFVTPTKIWYSFLDGDKQKKSHHHNDETSTINGHALSLEWVSANPKPEIVSLQPTPFYYNYFLGKNPDNWHTGIYGYTKLLYKRLYSHIDLEIDGLDNALKYTYFVKKDGNPDDIRIKISGAKKLYLKQGNLHIITTVNSVLEEAPVAFQTINGVQVSVPCEFKLRNNILSFHFPEGYNKEAELVIDPTVIFSTFSGSYADNFGFTATYDNLGNAYGGGTVYNKGFPVTAGAFQATFKGGDSVNRAIGDWDRDGGILKFSPDGKKLLWATYLGGTRNEQPHSMVADGNNNLIVFGTTYSKDFPVRASGYDTTHNGKADIYVVKFSEDGKTLLGGTFFGGIADDGLNGLIAPDTVNNLSALGYNYGDQFRGEVISDKFNNIYVGSTTFSKDLPVPLNAAQKDTGTGQDGCILKLNSSLTSLIWATYVGGDKEDAVFSLQVDTLNNVYACGGTTSKYFFKDTVTYEKALHDTAVDAFICVVKNNGTAFINSTYLGTKDYDQAYFIQLDDSQNVFVYGQTSSDSFPLKKARYKKAKSGQFITKLNNALDTVVFSSVFGSGSGIPDISPTAFLVDYCGRIYISGWGGLVNSPGLGHGGSTKNMHITPDAFLKTTDGSDFYIAVFANNMDTILYGTYFGSPIREEHVDGGTSRFDKKGIIYQSVCADCHGWWEVPDTTITTPGAYSRQNNSPNCNNLVFKINLQTKDIIANFDSVPPVCELTKVQFNNKSILGKFFLWDFGDGTTSTLYNPSHTYQKPGTYAIKLVAYNPISCSIGDSVIKHITIKQNSDSKFTATPKPCSNEVTYEAKGFGTNFRWDFGDSTFTAGRKVTHKYLRPGKYTVKLFADSATLCGTNSSQQVSVNFTTSLFRERYDTCKPIVYFTNYSVNAKTSLWIFSDGTTDTARNAVHEFTTPGLYDAILVTFDSTGCSDTSGVFITIAGEPKASFNVIPDPCKHRINFKNTSILASTYIWDFGDGKTSTAKDVNHEYLQPGTYTVKLTINASSKCPRSFTQTVKITFPTAGFTHSFEECKPLVNFYNKSIFSQRYIWDFGDGITDTNKNPKHFYKTPGTYSVKMYAIDSAGCRDSAFISLQIGDTAAASFTIINDTCSGIVYFQNNSKMADTYLWKFGDGTTDTSKNPVHNYAVKDKEYTVTLIINYHPDGCIDSITQKVTPYSPPRASFSYLKDSCTSIVEFTSTNYRAHTYLWDFGDGLTSTEKNPKHPYTGKGEFNVRFIINPFTECADTVENSVFIPRGELSKPEIYNVITPNGDDLNEVFHIENLSQCHFYELEIYNRWGQIIYENKGNKMFWDGTTMKGKAVAEGVYFYIFRDPIFGQQHGTITVIR